MQSKIVQAQAIRSYDTISRKTVHTESNGASAAPPAYGLDVLDHPKDQSNPTGLPDRLKSGIENLSGLSMNDVRVHYNSSKPAQLQALAYTQGTNIHVGPGQEQHLPHEAWHVVQQAQGRVQPTMQMKSGIPVNNDKGLEDEATAMGEKAVQRWGMDNAPYGDPDKDPKLQSLKKTKTNTKMPGIVVKRNHIHLLGNDKYGHWWTEMKGTKSYGWWPKNKVDLKGTLFGVPGELNGQTSFGGTPTKDPHHGDTPDETLSVSCTDSSKTESTVLAEIDAFASKYSGEWRWTFGFGQNCHTFQESLLANSSLVID